MRMDERATILYAVRAATFEASVLQESEPWPNAR